MSEGGIAPIILTYLAVLAPGFEETNRKAKSSIDGVGSSADGVKGKLGEFAKGGALAAVAIGVASIKMAGDFQQGMTSLVTGAGESEDAIGKVSKGILSLAPQVGESTKQLTDGMYMIESAGYHGADGLSVLKAAAEGAKAGNADLGTVANGVTTALTDYHLKASDAANVTSKLVETVASGKTHMADLATALSTVLPVASSAGVNLDQVSGAMATLTAKGTSAQLAAMQIRTVMLALLTPTKGAQSAFDGVGLSAEKVAGTLQHQGLQQALAQVSDAAGKVYGVGTPKYLEAMKQMLGGTRGLSAGLNLTGDNMATFQTNVANISKATADAKGNVQGWGLVQKDFNFKLEQAKAWVETLGIKLGTVLIPAVEKAAMWIIEGVRQLGKLGPAIHQVSEFVERMWKDAQPYLEAFGKYVDTVLWPMLQRFWTRIQPLLHNIAVIIKTTFDVAVKIIKEAISIIVELWDRFGNHLLEHLRQAWTDIQTVFKGAFEVIQGLFAFFSDLFQGHWSKLWGDLVEIVSGFWKIILGTVEYFINEISTVIGLAMAVISMIWEKVWFGIKAVAEAIWGGIKALIVGYVDLIKWEITTALTIIEDAWNTVWGAISGAVVTVWDKIKSTVSDGITKIHTALDTFVGYFTGLPARLKNVGAGIFDGLKDAFKDVINTIIGWWDSFVDHLHIHIPAFTLIPGTWVTDPVRVGPIDADLGSQEMHINKLAAGGIVLPSMGGSLAQIAEAGRPEAVIPLGTAAADKYLGGGDQGPIYITVPISLDGQLIATNTQTHLLRMKGSGQMPVVGLA